MKSDHHHSQLVIFRVKVSCGNISYFGQSHHLPIPSIAINAKGSARRSLIYPGSRPAGTVGRLVKRQIAGFALEHFMGYRIEDSRQVWSDLTRKEEELKWGGNYGSGTHYDSMGHPASGSNFHGGWGYEQMGRVQRVSQALRDSGPSAKSMITRQLTGIDLSAIWHILISTCEDIALCYGGSVLAGGFVGSVGGVLFGGVGVVPGAMAGAAAGSYVGSWLLALLGLKSLVAGVTHAVPEALGYYQRGFREAWGPTRHDHQQTSGPYVSGDPRSGAFYIAQGHVLMISAILAVLLAYLTKGKGDKDALLAEIRQSPRLGPKVATWMEQNADRLRLQPALRPRGGGGMAHAEPPPQRRRESQKTPERHRPAGMPQKKVPCFTTKGLPQGHVPEFDRQLAGQESGINSMTVEEYLKGRMAFAAGDSVRNRGVAREARENYKLKLAEQLSDSLQEQGLPRNQAKAQAAAMASDKMKTLAALHNPDMVAGGKDVIGDCGDCNINKRIGAQWNKGERLSQLDSAAKQIPESLRNNTKMNAKLERCK